MYPLLESPYRWLIAAGLAFGAGLIGTIALLAFTAPHWLASTWLYLCLAVTAVSLVLAFIDWRDRVEEELNQKPPTP